MVHFLCNHLDVSYSVQEVRGEKAQCVAASNVIMFDGLEFHVGKRKKYAHDDTYGFPFGSLRAVANKTN